MSDFFHRHTFRNGLLALSLLGAIQVAAQPLSGTYTINPGPGTIGTNFASFTDAVASLATNGISGSVVFDVAANTYTEQVIIPEISGASASQTITFNTEGATLQYNSTNSAQRAVLQLNGADYVTINNLNITGTGNTASEYGYGIQLTNGADHNHIRGCKITVSLASSASIINNFAGILVNSVPDNVSTQGNTNCHYNLIEDNTVIGGYYGIALVANSDVSMINGNEVRNNSIKDFYRAGVYLDGNNATVVSGNDISRPNINSGLYWGISMYNGNTDVQVTGNRLHDPFGVQNSSSGAFGFYLFNSFGTAGHENVFSNNLIYNFNSNGITDGAEFSGTCNYNKFIHNTIVLNHTSSTGFTQARGIAINAPMTGLTITNNIVYITRSTQGGKHCIYFLSTPTSSVINNNNLVMASTASGVASGVGYVGSNRTTLNDWQTASGFDGASIGVDPMFTNAAGGDFLPTNTDLQAGVPIATTGIVADILGMGRNTTPLPTLGAYEIDGFVLPVSLSALSGRINASGNARLSWETYSETGNKGFTILKSEDGIRWNEAGFVASAANSNSHTTIAYSFTDEAVINGTVYYRLQQTDLDGSTRLSNIVTLRTVKEKVLQTLVVYPNPAKDQLFLQQSALTEQDAVITITDIRGSAVATARYQNGAATDISNLTPGIYYITVTQAGQVQQTRFIKTR